MSVTRRHIYLAGPMRGYDAYNFPLFHRAREELRAAGHEVFCPAENSITQLGYDPSKRSAGGIDRESGARVRELLKMDLIWICDHADAIVCLPGAMSSSGATSERFTALALDDPKCEVLEFFNARDRVKLGLKPLVFCECP